MSNVERIAPTTPPLRPGRSTAGKVEWLILSLLVLLRLVITWNQPLGALHVADLDDRMFIDRAETITQMKWMGDYNQWTLMKGPAYPLVIATTYLLGIPLGRFQQILWVLASVAFVRASAPVMGSVTVRILATVVLLFTPQGFNTSALARVLRQAIYPSLTLLVVACAIAIFLRVGSERRRGMIGWVVALSVVLPVFWLNRDEGLWIVPTLGLLGALTLLKAARSTGWKGVPRTAALLSTPWLVLAAALLTVCTINWRFYGVFATIDLRSNAFLNAYGALARVRPDPSIPDTVVVSKEARRLMYEVSPAFSELKPYLEGSTGQYWAGLTVGDFGPMNGEIYGGWWLWTFRDSVNRTPHGRSGTASQVFYQRIADEVNRACDEGRLPAEPFRPTLTPPWRPGYAPKLLASFTEGWKRLVVYSSIPPVIPTSNAVGISRFQKYTQTALTPPYPAEDRATVLVGRTTSISSEAVIFDAVDASGRKVRLDQVWRDDPEKFRQTPRDPSEIVASQFRLFELMLHDIGDFTLVARRPDGQELARFQAAVSNMQVSGLKIDVLEKCELPRAGGQEWRVRLLGRIFDAYQRSTWWLLWPAGAGLVVAVVRGFRGHGWDTVVVVAALLVGINVLLLLLGYIHFTSFPALSKGYLAPLPGCLLGAMLLSLAAPVEAWSQRRARLVRVSDLETTSVSEGA